MQHPIQPLLKDDNGVLRFKQNAIVKYLLDAGPFDMNKLLMLPFSQEDQEQFAQLIGYSLSGFGDLSYVSDETYNLAEAKSKATQPSSKATQPADADAAQSLHSDRRSCALLETCKYYKKWGRCYPYCLDYQSHC